MGTRQTQTDRAVEKSLNAAAGVKHSICRSSRWLAASVLVAMMLLGLTGQPAGASETTAVEIEQAVRQRLSTGAMVPPGDIDIRVDKGIVVLSGTVKNLLQKYQARQVAESIRGVRSVVDLMSVKPLFREDEAIVRDIRQALAESPALRRYDIAVAVDRGVVTLQGTVDAWVLSRLARHLAMSIKGVSDVYNRIDVKTGLQRSDGEIQTLVERRLAADLYVDAAAIVVDVHSGVVTLKGSVGTAAEKRRAEEDARIFGVDAVNLQALVINPDVQDRMRRQAAFLPLSDDTVLRAVKDALALDPRVNAYSVDVSVTDGLVTLIGVVDTLSEKKIAERDVLNTTGVWRVKNKLTLRYRAFPTDDEVEKRIAAVFERDAELHNLDVHVAVEDLHCRLYGTVDARAQKIRAENIAAQIGGVLSLENDLRVNAKERPDPPGDAEIAARIRDELFWSPFVDSDRIEVTVKDQRAVLNGAAAGLFAAHSAVQNTFEGGARSVRTALSLDTGSRLDAYFKRDTYQFRLGRIFPDDSL